MGLTKKHRKKYATPRHPWQAERIQEEKKITKDFGLKNKKEIWKMASMLKGFKDQTKKLTARTDAQAQKEEKLLIVKLQRLGLLKEGATLDAVLDIALTDVLQRRLQSVIVTKGFARTTKQARQFITHGHINVKEKKMNTPSYMVSVEEESNITFAGNSALKSDEHPERASEEKKEKSKVITPVKKPIQKVDTTKVKVEKPKEAVVPPAA